MRIAAVGATVLTSLVFAALAAAVGPSVGLAQRSGLPPATAAGGLIALPTAVGQDVQQVTVIDPQTRVLGVYHIELSSGEVTLKSVRNIHWDLQMMEFNGTKPLPGDVRSILEQP